MTDWDAVLEATAEDLATLEGSYRQALREKTLPQSLLVRVKNILENQRSALDFVAHDLTSRFGTVLGKAQVYYPLAPTSAKFNGSIDRFMPDVRTARPDLAQTIQQFQPFNCEWLRALRDLVNPNKHVRLSPQERMEMREIAVTDRTGGRSALFGNVQVGPVGPNGEPGIAFGPGGGISLGEGGIIGFGPAGVSFQGAPIDPRTQRPVAGAPVRVQEEIWVDWLFEGTERPVLATLNEIQNGVRAAIDAIITVA
jgi:hypothetical protein